MNWRERVLRTLDYSTRPSLFNKYSITALVFMSEVFHILASGDLAQGYLVQRIIAAAISVIPALLCVYLFQQIAHRISLLSRIALVLFSYVVAGSLRGVSLSFMLSYLNLISFQESLWRIPTGVTLIGTAMGLINYLSCVVSIQSSIAADLAQQNQKLQESYVQLEETSKRENREEVRGIVNVILENMDDISLKQDAGHVAEVEALVKDYIRPLTHEIAASVAEWRPNALLTSRPKISEAFMKIEMVNLLPTVALGVLIAWVRIPGAIKYNGLTYALTEAILSSVMYLVTAPHISRFIVKLWNPKSISSKLILISLALISTAIPIHLTEFVVAQVLGGYIWLPFSIYLGLSTFGILSIFSKSALEQSLIQTDRLVEIEKQLAWMIARVNLLTWYNRGVVARILHGPIQNSFQATLIRMRSGSEQDSHQVIVDLQHRLSEIEILDTSSKSLASELRELKQLWREIAAVNYDFEESVEGIDEASRAIATDLIQEIVSNAVRHGNATNIDICLTLENEVLKIEINDNGNQKLIDTPAGMGSQMLYACTITQISERHGQMNSLTVTIPVVSGDERSRDFL